VKLATALRMFIRLGHENPAMGKFMVRFGLTDESLRGILSGQPARDIAAGIAAGRYTIPASMQLSVASFMAGATVSAMWMVLEGHQGWREAGASTAELLLRSLGVAPEEATRIAALDLPAMPES
jgi:hypothetical protein